MIGMEREANRMVRPVRLTSSIFPRHLRWKVDVAHGKDFIDNEDFRVQGERPPQTPAGRTCRSNHRFTGASRNRSTPEKSTIASNWRSISFSDILNDALRLG